MELTQEQQAFLAECEEEFKDRYTDKDAEFMKIKSMDSVKPPIIDPWYNAPQRSNNRYGRNRDQDRNRDQGRHRGNYRPNSHSNSRYSYNDNGPRTRRSRNKKRRRHSRNRDREKSSCRGTSRDRNKYRSKDRFEGKGRDRIDDRRRSADRINGRSRSRDRNRDRADYRHRNYSGSQYQERGMDETRRENNDTERYRCHERENQNRRRKRERDSRYDTRRDYSAQHKEKMGKHFNNDEETAERIPENQHTPRRTNKDERENSESKDIGTERQIASKHPVEEITKLMKGSKSVEKNTEWREIRNNKGKENMEKNEPFQLETAKVENISSSVDSEKVGKIEDEDKHPDSSKAQTIGMREMDIASHETSTEIEKTRQEESTDNVVSCSEHCNEMINNETTYSSIGIKIDNKTSMRQMTEITEEIKSDMLRDCHNVKGNESYMTAKTAKTEVGASGQKVNEYHGLNQEGGDCEMLKNVHHSGAEEKSQTEQIERDTMLRSRVEKHEEVETKNLDDNIVEISDSMNNNFIKVREAIEKEQPSEASYEDVRVERQKSNISEVCSNKTDANIACYDVEEQCESEDRESEISIIQVFEQKRANKTGYLEESKSIRLDGEQTNIDEEGIEIHFEQLSQTRNSGQLPCQEDCSWQMITEVGCEVEVECPNEVMEDEVSMMMKNLVENQNQTIYSHNIQYNEKSIN